ncbi:MAG: TraR/DksA C4-type zinc finger protein [Terrimicrobiaceae bacterium]|nr:TraR/DksA C4-type zinc finger protein [Terrimicrobiaceae bacterium]
MKSAPKKAPARPSAVAKKPAAKPSPKPAVANKPSPVPVARITKPVDRVAVKLTPFLANQRQKLLMLKDTLLDSMNGVARDSLRSQTGGDASAFGMHQADAGSDAYDRDFALSLLSQEQDSLYEINEALKRIDAGNYGVCEMSGKQISKPRLEALPFTRYTIECQAEIEKRNRYQRNRQPVTSLFGLTDEDSDGEEEETTADSKEKD